MSARRIIDGRYELLVGAPPFPSDDPLVVIRQHLDEQPSPVRATRPDVPAAEDDMVASPRRSATDRLWLDI